MKNKNKLLNAIKENNFMVGLTTYRKAMLNLNTVSIALIDIINRKHSKDEIEHLDKQYDRAIYLAYACIVDSLSDLLYLYCAGGLTRSARYAVRGIFKFCMSKKNLRPIIKRACKKNKHSSLRNLYKKYKKKIKVS